MIIDVLFALFLLWGFYRGFTKGLIIAICTFLAYLIGIVGALKFTHVISIRLSEILDIHDKFLPFIAFLIIFIVLVLIVRFGGFMLTKIIDLFMLSLVNKLLGGVLWCLIYVFMFSTILWVFHQVNLISPELKTESIVYGYLEPLSSRIISWIGILIPFFKDTFQELEHLFEELATKSSPLAV